MAAATALDPEKVLGVPASALPRHVAIIMDGNGRWAKQRGLHRNEGHREGAKTVREITEQCARLGIEYLTLYSFSIENWKRPADEVAGLMALYVEKLIGERQTLIDNRIRLVQLGRRTNLPLDVVHELSNTEGLEIENPRMTLCLALNYGSRTEIVDAVRAISAKVKSGALTPEQIDETTIAAHLYTADIPDPDLLIRTAGEMRLSNFLLWQLSYAELYVSQVFWPEFRKEHLYEALRAYAGRERRFGAVVPAGSQTKTDGVNNAD